MKIRSLVFLILLLPSMAWAKRVKTVRLRDDTVSIISISHRGAVLNFPTKPSKVVMGNQGAFAVEYINNDLAISPLRSNARAHVFVYLEGRRFNLDLIATPKGHTLVLIRDTLDNQVEISYAK